MSKLDTSFLTKNWFPIFVWVMGLIFAGSNIYTATKVTNAELVKRVEAVEKEQKTDDEAAAVLLPRFYVVETKVDQIMETLVDNADDRKQADEEIKASQLRLEQKVDTLLLNQNTVGGTR